MKAVVSLLCVLISGLVHAQKENNVWMGGQESGINFNSGAPVPFERPSGQRFWRTNTSICDSDGNLLFYTNGYNVFNKNLDVMQNGGGLDIGDYIAWGYDLLSVHDGAVIIPKPLDAGRYYIFHTDLNYTDFDTFINKLMCTHVYYSLADMSLDGGLGGLVSGQKNILLFSDTLVATGFKAVKHGNGRDYWVLCHEAGSNRFYRFLVDPSGIHGPYEQYIGGDMDGFDSFGFNVMAFTQDGSSFAQGHIRELAVHLCNFNRCTGELYNLNTFAINDSMYNIHGLAFSPNQRYLYLSVNYLEEIAQFDLQAPNIYASKQTVAQFSGALNPFFTRYDKLLLGPDGKIYVSTYDECFSLHVIHQPDSAGLACQFEENGLQLDPPAWSWSGVPNTVNYSLGALAGSGCDTLTSVEVLSKPSVGYNVYPNPFADKFQLRINGVSQNVELEIVNVLNQRVHQAVLSPHSGTVKSEIDLSSLPGGVYVLKFVVNGERYAVRVVKGD